MSSFILLTSQRNDVFKTIQDSGFVPSDFEWGEVESRISSQYSRIPQLRHIPTGFHFSIGRAELRNNETGFYVTYSPGNEILHQTEASETWSNVVGDVVAWLSNVRRETEIPDLWEKLARDNELVQRLNEESSDNLLFTQNELPQVRKSLEEIKAYVISANELSEAQRKLVHARFNYMEEAATRMGRKDWVNIVISNLLSIAITLSLSGNSTRDLFRFAGQVVRQLLGTVLYLAGPH